MRREDRRSNCTVAVCAVSVSVKPPRKGLELGEYYYGHSQFYLLPHTRQSGETMTFVLAGHIITDTDPTSRKRVARAGIEPTTPSPGVARSRRDWKSSNIFQIFFINSSQSLVQEHFLSKICLIFSCWLFVTGLFLSTWYENIAHKARIANIQRRKR